MRCELGNQDLDFRWWMKRAFPSFPIPLPLAAAFSLASEEVEVDAGVPAPEAGADPLSPDLGGLGGGFSATCFGICLIWRKERALVSTGPGLDPSFPFPIVVEAGA